MSKEDSFAAGIFNDVPPATSEDMEINLGEQAQQGLLSNELYHHPIIQRFLVETENHIINGMKQTRNDEYEKREDFFRMLKMLDSFKAMMVHYINRGSEAERMLANLRTGKFDAL